MFITMNKPFAKKSFGQNFLIDQNYISKIISALNPKPIETIIEIGAGRGALTKSLVESGADVIAIELDRDLIPLLENEFGGENNFRLVEEDALKIDFAQILQPENKKTKAKLVANLPYYISTAILQKLIEQRENFSELVLMLQKEVVERITAEAGQKERGFLTVLIGAFFETQMLFDVPPTAFRPVPKVWSAVIRLKTKAEMENQIKDEQLFREIISRGFGQKRKTILNNLKNLNYFKDLNNKSPEEVLSLLHIYPQRRAETLTVDEWVSLANYLSKS